MAERRPDSSDPHEALQNPGREHMGRLATLAHRMVFMFGVPTDDSRTFMWNHGGRTYFLGRGGEAWQTMTGEAATSDNWLHILDDETNEQTTHLIGSSNDMLADDTDSREEVAAVLCAEMARQLVTMAAERFPGNPGTGVLYHDEIYRLKVFGQASAMPFALVRVGGVQHELAADSWLEPSDTAQLGDSPLATSPEERLIVMSAVLADDTPEERIREPEEEVAPAPTTPESITTLQATIIEDYADIIRDWNTQDIEGLDLWEEAPEEFVLRTTLANTETGIRHAYGVIVAHGRVFIETVTVDPPGAVRERLVVNLGDTRTAMGWQSVNGKNAGETRGGEAFMRAHLLLTQLEAAVADGEVENTGPQAWRLFQTPPLRPPTASDNVQ